MRQTIDTVASLLNLRPKDELKTSTLAYEQLEKQEPLFSIAAQAGGHTVFNQRILAGQGFTDVASIGNIHNFQ